MCINVIPTLYKLFLQLLLMYLSEKDELVKSIDILVKHIWEKQGKSSCWGSLNDESHQKTHKKSHNETMYTSSESEETYGTWVSIYKASIDCGICANIKRMNAIKQGHTDTRWCTTCLTLTSALSLKL